MNFVLLASRLKVADPTAMTALETLRSRLELAGELAALSREEIFLFETAGGGAEDLALVRRLAVETNLFLNPNKHLFRLAAEAWVPGLEEKSAALKEPAPRKERAGADSAPALAWLLVWAAGEGEELRESLWRHIGATGIQRVRRAWLWHFTGAAGVEPARLEEVVTDAGVLRSRTRGFLVHPAYQEWRLFTAPPGVLDVARAFGALDAPDGTAREGSGS